MYNTISNVKTFTTGHFPAEHVQLHDLGKGTNINIKIKETRKPRSKQIAS